MTAARALLLPLLVIGISRSLRAQPESPPDARTLRSGLRLHEPRPDRVLSDLDVPDAYAEALRLEREIVEMYRETRAAELSIIQQQTLRRSLTATLTPLGERAEVDADLLRQRAVDAAAVEEYQRELGVVMRETEAIVVNARDLLARFLQDPAASPVSASGDPETSGGGEAAERMEDAAEHLEAVLREIGAAEEQVAAELGQAADVEETRKWRTVAESVARAERAVEHAQSRLRETGRDPSPELDAAERAVQEMRQALAAVTEMDRSVPEPSEHPEVKRHTEEALAQAEKALESLTQAKAPSAEQRIARKQVLEELARAESGTALDLTAPMRGERLTAPPLEADPSSLPPMGDLENAPVARRVVANSGRGGEWVFIGDWYVLARFDNPNRTNLRKVYPPESVLDLDARYRSEDGAPLRWDYESYAPPMVVPTDWESWKIYYFFTELTFEEETEAWLAIGSDDRSDVWINDFPVWHSANEHKSWTPDEGFRKVVFRQGRNPILVRLENGQRGLGFSLFLHLPR